MTRVLVVRLDSDGDVLLSGPAIRAVAAGADEVITVVGPRGRQAAGLLPGPGAVTVWRCPWVDGEPPPVTRADTTAVVDALAALQADEALVLTSFHQSPLPTALVLRMAGVPRITAASVDYAGSLLDVRLRPGDPAVDPTVDLPDDLPEPERALAVAARAGYALPAGDDGRLAVSLDDGARREAAEALAGLDGGVDGGVDGGGDGGYVVLHPGASVPARAWSPHRAAEGAAALAAAGHRVVVTGAPGERELTAQVAAAVPDGRGVDLGGRTSFGALAAVLAGARAVVVGNTGPAHLAAAVGVPVVSLFAPVVPPQRWAPYGVRRILLGDQDAACRGTRARTCPVPGHPCLDSVRGAHIVDAVASMLYGE